MKIFDWPTFFGVSLRSVYVGVGVFSAWFPLSPPPTSGMLDGVTCDLLLAEMQAMRQAGPVIRVSCQDGAVCLCVCVCCARAREAPLQQGGTY